MFFAVDTAAVAAVAAGTILMAAPGVKPSPSAGDKSTRSDTEEGVEEHEELNDRQLRRKSAVEKLMSPLEVRFSQMRARLEFRDERSLEEAVEQIKPVEREIDGEKLFYLDAPFPAIEVMKWRCKLRDGETGRPRVDSRTGGELYDSSENLFTLDNRRLYCLQKVATSLYPKKCVVDIVELPPGAPTRVRELKKFRTLDRGRSVMMGGRQDGETLTRWSWRQAVGLADDGSEPDEQDCPVYMRRRPRGAGHGRPGSGGGSSASVAEDDGGSWPHPAMKQISSSPLGSVAFFIVTYAMLRFGARFVMPLSGAPDDHSPSATPGATGGITFVLRAAAIAAIACALGVLFHRKQT